MTKKELLQDINQLIYYISEITGSDFKNCAVYDICKKYE